MKFFCICITSLLVSTLSFAQELALVKDNGQIGYISTTGEKAIEIDFPDGSGFSEGLAAVYDGKKWGYIDSSGNFVIQPKYDQAKDFNAGIALVKVNKKSFYIDKNEQKLPFNNTDKWYEFSKDGVAIYRKGKKVGLINTQGKIVVEPKYDIIRPFENGFARVFNNGMWGILNAKGEEEVKIEYREIGRYYKGYIWAKKEEILGILHNGVFKGIEEATKIKDITDPDHIVVRIDKLYGMVDAELNWILEPIYNDMRAYSMGLIPVKLGKKWGYVNKDGQTMIEFFYSDALEFNNGLAAVKDHKWGFLNTKGDAVIPLQYDITAFSFGPQHKGFIKGFVRVKWNKKWGFLDGEGKLLGNTWYDNAELFSK